MSESKIPDNNSLYPRLITPIIHDVLSDTPVLCLLGPRQSGKTTLVKSLFPSRPYVSMDDPFDFESASDYSVGFLDGYPDQLTIDEVQIVPALIPAIKVSVDRDRRPGRFLLTGSANLLSIPSITESLTGRMEIIELQPLSEAEKFRGNGKFLLDLIQGNLAQNVRNIRATNKEISIENRVMSGGYTEPLKRTEQRARDWRRQYLRNTVERDVPEIFDIRKSELLFRLLELLAFRTGQLLSVTDLASRLGAHRITVERYLTYLERVYIIRRLPAWDSNYTKRLVKAPKVHFVDSGLAATLMGLPVQDWQKNRNFFGHLLESFVVQQIFTQIRWTNSDLRIWHYRDKDKVEVDLVVTLGAKTWGIEVKSSSMVRSSDTSGLLRLATRCGDDFQKGIVLYNGDKIMPFASGRVLAVPLSELWTR